MKKQLYILPILLVMAVSCAKESPVIAEGDISEISMTVGQFEPEDGTATKLSISVNTSTSVRNIAWEDTDKVGIFPDKGGYQLGFSLEGQGGSAHASFDGGGWALRDDAAYSAYFPFNFDNKDLTQIPVDYTDQFQSSDNDTSHLGNYTYCASVPTSAIDGKVSFDIQQLGALVWMSVTLPEPGEYVEFVLATDAGADLFTIKGTYSLEADSGHIITPTYQSNAVMLFLDSMTTTSSNQVVNAYMMVAPANITGHTYSFYAITAENKVFKADLSNKNHEFKKGQFKKITVTGLSEVSGESGLEVTCSGEDMPEAEDW